METSGGNVEFYGWSRVLGGLIVGGWIDLAWSDPTEPPSITVRAGGASTTAEALFYLYARHDVADQGRGFLLLVEAPEALAEEPVTEVALAAGEARARIFAHTTPPRFAEDGLFAHLRQVLGPTPPDPVRTRLLTMLDRPHYAGVDTLDGAAWPVHLQVDSVYFCPPDGFAIRGWFLDPFGRVAQVRACCGATVRTLDPGTWVRTRRRDVIDTVGLRYGLTDDLCGFIATVPGFYRPGAATYFEIEMIDGSVAFRPFAASLFTGLPAIKALLASFELRRDALAAGFDHVIGPAVEAMNAFRLRTPPAVTILAFGAEPERPRCSIVVPLYGRIDFLEYQLAVFADALAADHEILYVLDDPDRRGETEALAASAHARFGRSFKLLCLDQNRGYAPANNVGLRHARGEAVCFLNSDAFPRSPRWLESMLATLAEEPGAGVVGARLLYEDGTLQHDGCTFERLPEFGGWPFPMHPGKGLHVAPKAARAAAEVVTGACMVMRTDLARDLGGFDEGFVIGDFEDADLCLRIRDRGLACVVDNTAELYHLERQSQNLGASAWRMNLTLFNAWRFQARWSGRDF